MAYQGHGMTYAVECVHCQKTLLTTHRSGTMQRRVVADHLETGHPGALGAPAGFEDPGLTEIPHHVRVTTR